MREMTKRWDRETGEYIKAPEVDAFLEDIVAVCEKHGMSLGHEDCHSYRRTDSQRQLVWGSNMRVLQIGVATREEMQRRTRAILRDAPNKDKYGSPKIWVTSLDDITPELLRRALDKAEDVMVD